MKLQMLAATAAMMMFATAAAAQDQAPPAGGQGGGGGRGMQACAADMQKFCGDKTDRAARHQCMMDNKDKLSDGCKAAAAAAMQRRQEMQGQKPQ